MFRTTATAAALVVLLAGCGSAGQPAPYDSTGIDELQIPSPSPRPADFVADVDHPWLAWEPGESREFTVTAAGREVGTMTRTVGAAEVDVAGIAAVEVTEVVRLQDEPPQRVTGVFAQDRQGHVWWLAGTAGGAEWSVETGDPAGLLLPATPRVGDGWVSVEAAGARQVVRVEAPRDLDTVAGSWDRVMVVEVTQDHARQQRYYARGVGLVRVVDLADGFVMEMNGPPVG